MVACIFEELGSNFVGLFFSHLPYTLLQAMLLMGLRGAFIPMLAYGRLSLLNKEVKS